MAFVYVLEDKYYWENCDTGQLVPYSRHQDPCFSSSFSADYPYPAVVPHTSRPKSGDNNWRINQAWWDYWKAIVIRFGGGEAAWDAARRNNGGIINWAANQNYPPGVAVPDPPDNGWPIMEGVTTAGNYHEIVERTNGSTRLKAFVFSDGPPNIELVNPITHRELFVHFRGISNKGVLGNAPDGYKTWVPLVVREQCWIVDEKLKFGVDLPKEASEPMKPLWRDYSRYDYPVNASIAKLNGVKGMAARSGISWGYKDMWFTDTYDKFGEENLYRTSYHVIYTDQPVVKQLDNWYGAHPEIDMIPRVIDLEVDRLDSAPHKAEMVWDMSNIILSRDGVRPWIYSRKSIVDPWLASWTPDMLNAHRFWLAQYNSDRTVERTASPTLPNNVDLLNVILHQTADKKPPFPGETGRVDVADWDRWLLGDEFQMHQFLANEYGGGGTPVPAPFNEHELGYMDALMDMETDLLGLENGYNDKYAGR